MATTWHVPAQPKNAEAGTLLDTEGKLWILRQGESFWKEATKAEVAEFAQQQYAERNGND